MPARRIGKDVAAIGKRRRPRRALPSASAAPRDPHGSARSAATMAPHDATLRRHASRRRRGIATAPRSRSRSTPAAYDHVGPRTARISSLTVTRLRRVTTTRRDGPRPRRAPRAAPGARAGRSAAARAPGGTPCPSRSIHAASMPAACAAPTSSANVSPTSSAASRGHARAAAAPSRTSSGCGLRSPSDSETTTASTRAEDAVAVQDVVGAAGVVEVAHHRQPVRAGAARRAASACSGGRTWRRRARDDAPARAPRRPPRTRARRTRRAPARAGSAPATAPRRDRGRAAAPSPR